MSFTRIILGPLLFAVLTLLFDVNNAYHVKMTNAVCESNNKSLIVFIKCRLRAVSRNKTMLTIHGNLIEPANNIYIRFQSFKKANGYKPWLMDYTIDVCRAMRHRYHPIITIDLNILKDTTTFRHPCPFVGVNGIRDFHQIDNLPVISPTGDYFFGLTWSLNNKITFYTNVSFSFVEDN